MTRQTAPSAELTAALSAEGSGVDQVLPLLYDDLKAMARRQIGRELGQRTLSATDLIHEAYLKLVDRSQVTARGRSYFFGAAARAMRQILVDHARRKRRNKRGGGAGHVTLATGHGEEGELSVELLDLDRALERLADLSERQARVVECRYFGGLTVPETAEALGVSARTVKGDWALARAWLYEELQPAPRPGSSPD